MRAAMLGSPMAMGPMEPGEPAEVVSPHRDMPVVISLPIVTCAQCAMYVFALLLNRTSVTVPCRVLTCAGL